MPDKFDALKFYNDFYRSPAALQHYSLSKSGKRGIVSGTWSDDIHNWLLKISNGPWA